MNTPKAFMLMLIIIPLLCAAAAQETNHVVLSPVEQARLRPARVRVGLPVPPVHEAVRTLSDGAGVEKTLRANTAIDRAMM